MCIRLLSALSGVVLVVVIGCAGFQPAPIEGVPFLERAQSRDESDLTVTVAVPSTREARALFDTKLHKKRIQPVWVEVRNESDEPVWFFPYSVDRDYFPPLEAAWKSHRTWAGKTNRKIDSYYYKTAFRSYVAPGATNSGFIFVNIDRGIKYVPMEVLGEAGVTEFEFIFDVPGFKADFTRVDLDSIYPDSAQRDLTDAQELRKWAAGLPCCTRDKKGSKTGDPINFVLVAPGDSLNQGFARTGWDLTAALTTGASIKTATSAVLGKTYRNAPMSSLYVLDRPQDFGLQKGRWNVHQRNHLRMWLAPVTYRGAVVWIGQISRDIGTRLTTKSATLTTHKIDPDVDEVRDFLLLDLWNAGVLAAFGYTTGVGPSTPDQPGRNLTGDPYFSDGLRASACSNRPVA